MAFFPIANTSKVTGFCTLHNYPPNNWEAIEECPKVVWAIYSDGRNWITKNLGQLGIGESKTYFYNDIVLNYVYIHHILDCYNGLIHLCY